MLGYLQKIGRALMVPVALLPAAAIMVGLGYWLSSGGQSVSGGVALLSKAGGAILENMPLLFAVGVAYGLSKDKDGAAALAGMVGYLVVTALLDPATVAQVRGVAVEQVPAAFQKIRNPFIGLLCGVIAAEVYNRFSGVELHKALAFFSGRRLVPIVTSLVMVMVAVVLMVVWPITYGALERLGASVAGLGAAGAGIYGFLNRLLIPVGMHHALNAVFWFDVVGINDIPNFLGGAQSIANGTATPGVTGMYQAGFFPVMMFGLPGAALAICQCAHASNRARVVSMMGAAALASFLTGVTEPLEFSFMFAAPLLYALHALLTGLSLYIAAAMHWMAGFGFSAGLIDFVLSSRNPLATGEGMLIAQGLFFFGLYYVLFRTLIIRFDLRTPGREGEEGQQAEDGAAGEAGLLQRKGGAAGEAGLLQRKSGAAGEAGVPQAGSVGPWPAVPAAAPVSTVPADLNPLPTPPAVASTASTALPIESENRVLARRYVEALGGFDNLTDIDACITRLRLTMADPSRADEARLKVLGAVGVIRLGDRNLQVVIGPQAERIADEMKAMRPS